MRIVLFSQSSWSIPSINTLLKNHQLVGLVTPLEGIKANPELIQFAQHHSIKIIPWHREHVNDIATWMQDESVDLGLCFGFSHKIPKEVFEIPAMGVVNIHFGKLPEFAGPSPLFWAIKKGESLLSISIHQIDERWDSGFLLREYPLPIFPGEPYGLVASRAASKTAEVLAETLALLEQVEKKPIPHNPTPHRKPSEYDLRIRWSEQTANEIESLVNASNLSYGGAITSFRGNPIRILEVSPADVNTSEIFYPGTVVYSDPNHGIYVSCQKREYLRINIIQLDGSIISGQKLAALGVRQHEKFI